MKPSRGSNDKQRMITSVMKRAVLAAGLAVASEEAVKEVMALAESAALNSQAGATTEQLFSNIRERETRTMEEDADRRITRNLREVRRGGAAQSSPTAQGAGAPAARGAAPASRGAAPHAPTGEGGAPATGQPGPSLGGEGMPAPEAQAEPQPQGEPQPEASPSDAAQAAQPSPSAGPQTAPAGKNAPGKTPASQAAGGASPQPAPAPPAGASQGQEGSPSESAPAADAAPSPDASGAPADAAPSSDAPAPDASSKDTPQEQEGAPTDENAPSDETPSVFGQEQSSINGEGAQESQPDDVQQGSEDSTASDLQKQKQEVKKDEPAAAAKTAESAGDTMGEVAKKDISKAYTTPMILACFELTTGLLDLLTIDAVLASSFFFPDTAKKFLPKLKVEEQLLLAGAHFYWGAILLALIAVLAFIFDYLTKYFGIFFTGYEWLTDKL